MKKSFFILYILNALPLAIISPFYPPLASSRGINTGLIGFIMAIFSVG